MEVQWVDCSMMDMTISKMLSPCYALDVPEEVVVGTCEVQDVADAQEGTSIVFL